MVDVVLMFEVREKEKRYARASTSIRDKTSLKTRLAGLKTQNEAA